MDLAKYGITKDNELLKVALTHSSYATENNIPSYERLEFLGDAVLQLIISDYFYLNTDLSEGDMTKTRASYVCEEALYSYAKEINLIKDIKLGLGLAKEENSTIAADVFEAVIAAIYLSAGYDNAKNFVLDVFLPFFEKNIIFVKDYKSTLQELVQTHQKTVSYELTKETGPAHNKTFAVKVMVEGAIYGEGVGKTKKEAEQRAAEAAINKKVG